jgi:hypothetical protein
LWERLRWPTTAAVVASAATAGVMFWTFTPRAAQVPATEVVVAPQVAVPAISEPVAQVVLAAPPGGKPALVPQQQRPQRQLPRVATPVQERITRRFYQLAYAPPELLANSRMMRVRVPRAALLSFGLPLSAYQAQDEKVAADVIYTEDGIARAIRFVETNSNNQE